MWRILTLPELSATLAELYAPFSGGSIGNHAQLSPTPIGDHVQRVQDHDQLRPAWCAKSLLARLPLAPWRPSRYVYLLPLNDSSSSSSP